MCTLQDIKCMLLSVIVHDVKATVQDVEAKENPENLTSNFY